MKTRQEFNNQIAFNKQTIAILEAENLELLKAALMTSDEKQWYTEQEEECCSSKMPKAKAKRIVGRVHWIGKFKDESTGQIVEVPRSAIVKIGDEWIAKGTF